MEATRCDVLLIYILSLPHLYGAGHKLTSSQWTNRSVLILYRGVHAGSYTGRGRSVTVDANNDKVHGNHESKLIAELRASAAKVTVVACTYKSKVVKDWLSRAGVKDAKLLDAKTKGRSMTPNELLTHAYDFVMQLPGHFDHLISVRADIVLKKSFVGQLSIDLNLEGLGFLWKEVNGKMPRDCSFKTSSFSAKCEASWLQNGERYADAMVVAPMRMVPDLRFALTEAVKYNVHWDQHSMFQHLKKQRGYTQRNVSTMIPGYWNSNPNTHSNPLFSLARRKHMQHRGHRRRLRQHYTQVRASPYST